MHGRTAHKELDPGRYLRWIRAGIAACAIDLPGHGERAEPGLEAAPHAMDVLARVLPEIDLVTDALADREWNGVFDLDRVAIGGMSLGGMAALRRLCDGHDFVCAAVESTTGWLAGLYGTHIPHLDPSDHLHALRPIPTLALHSEADTIVPFAVQAAFVEKLRARFVQAGSDPSLVTLTTGASDEHSGFGKVSHEAKTEQTAFFTKWLRPTLTSE
jgi:alpha-beta hydrolase superfamily lysophospholipase